MYLKRVQFMWDLHMNLKKINFADEFATLSINSDLRESFGSKLRSSSEAREHKNIENGGNSRERVSKNAQERIRQARSRAARIRSRSRGKWTPLNIL